MLSPLPSPPSTAVDHTTSPNSKTTATATTTTTTIDTNGDLAEKQQQQHQQQQHQHQQSIRFKAFPYSGVNEYYMQCEAHFLSLGAGDGKYGLWLDDGLARGVSSTSQTFGNEPLSDEGEKFGVLGVEVWVIGA